MRISSVHNPRLKAAARLRDHAERRRSGRTLVDGLREIACALRHAGCVESLFCLPEACTSDQHQRLLREAAGQGAVCYELSEAAFRRLAYGERGDGLVAVVRCPVASLEQLASAGRPLVVVLEAVEKPGNIGAVARTVDATGGALIIADGRTDIFNPNAIRASLGTLFTIPVAEGTSTEVRRWLEQHDYRVVAAAVEAERIYWEVDLAGRTAFVLGSEAAGLSDCWKGAAITPVRLPMRGAADSLNVSVTAAVLAFEWCRQSAAHTGQTPSR